ncbi:MAG: reverse transcriptase family protein, partial [Bacteroidota bacterium]
KNAINKRNSLFQNWLNNPSERNHLVYKNFRNKVTSMIRIEKEEANYKRLGAEPTTRSIFRSLKSFKSQNDNISNLPDLEDLNKYFASIGPLLSSKFPPSDQSSMIRKIDNTMVIFPTNELEVSKILNRMKNKKSFGYDGISNEILKCCSPVIEGFLARAFNKALSEHIFPDNLKIAKVIPLLKKGNRDVLENYRPISLLSSLSKVFESLLYKRMLNFCNRNNILSPNQYGFRSKRSCIDAILSVTECIRDQVDKKQSGHVCFIDLQKAFDTLDHKILLEKLEKLGFRGVANDVLKSYLQGRSQYISYGNTVTKNEQLHTGVPQGSILGPLLFLLYVNDLKSCKLNNKLTMFADDTSVVQTDEFPNNGITEDIKQIHEWCVTNKLSVNPKKCEVLSFGSKKCDSIVMSGFDIPNKKSCKYLGVHLDGQLKFNEHIKHVTNKLNQF